MEVFRRLFLQRLHRAERLSESSMHKVIESSIISRHGPPSEIREFRVEAQQNRVLTWKLKLETVSLECFRSGENAQYFAEAIAVYPKEPRPVPSNPGVQQPPASGRR